MKFFVFFLLFSFTSPLSQAWQNDQSSDTGLTAIQKQYQTLRANANLIPIDSTYRACHELLNEIGAVDATKSRNDSIHNEVKGKIWLILINYHGYSRQYDSLNYYYDLIQEKISNPETLGIANLYMARTSSLRLNFAATLQAYDESLKYLSDNPILSATVLIELGQFYYTSHAMDYARDIRDILLNRIDSLSPFLNAKIQLYDAQIEGRVGNHKKSLEILQEVDVAVFKNDLLSKKGYFQNLGVAYLENGNPVEALKYVDKAYDSLNVYNNEYTEHALYAQVYLELGDMTKVLYHIEKAENVERFSPLGKHRLLNVKYRAYKQTNEYEKALSTYEDYIDLADSIQAIDQENRSRVINYRLQKDEEIRQINQAKRESDIASEKEKQRLYFLLLTVVLVMGLIFLYVYTVRKRKNLETELALQKERELSSLKNSFMENLSHEFVTPINIILGYQHLIKMNALQPQKVAAYADVVSRNGKELTETLNNFLSILKRGEGIANFGLSKSSENLGFFLKQTVGAFIGTAEVKEVVLQYKSNLIVNGAKVEFYFDGLKKILNNLIGNAIKFSGSDAPIYITTALRENQLYMAVKDEGVGIPESEQKKVFERFYQASDEHNHGGFGVGLSLVKNLVDQMGGEIRLESEPEVGTLFEVTIPLALDNFALYISSDDVNFERLGVEALKEPVRADLNKNLPKALIIEDSVEMSEYLKEVLSTIVQITTAYNGREALEKVNETNFNIIISDLRMPLMDGFQFKSELNKLKSYQDVPYLMMSASPIEYDVAQRELLGINQYIKKPFSGLEMASRVKLLLKTDVYENRLFDLEEEPIEFEDEFSELMSTVNQVVIKNMTNPEFNIKILASDCGMSESQLFKTLQTKTGLSPVRIILEIRLLKAYELVSSGRFRTIKEIMFEVGISSRTYFNKVFTERFGITPGDLIRLNKKG